MLEKPDIREEDILACLQTEYGIVPAQFEFLPLGADLNTAVYRAAAQDGAAWFVKLRRGVFDETSVALPRALYDQGIPQIIAPLAIRSGRLWADLADFKLILYPFVQGRNGYEMELSDAHWVEFGRALQRIHTARLPRALLARIQHETYPPQARESVRAALQRIEEEAFSDPLSAELAAYLKTRKEEILDLVDRAERLARELQARQPEFVVCHSDLHAGNLLITASDDLYIVDWDAPILACRERDLMYAGGGQFGGRRAPQEEERLFYAGYGPAQVDPAALAYYRCERIVQDLAVECEQILSGSGAGGDRAQAFEYLKSNFLPNGALAIAKQAGL
ncbi:MAG: phosphotransferase [Chloroflexota bacterium]